MTEAACTDLETLHFRRTQRLHSATLTWFIGLDGQKSHGSPSRVAISKIELITSGTESLQRVMTCAGFLVVGNSHPAFVEICTGVLTCSLDAESRPDSAERSLPPLEPRRMATLQICTRASSQKMEHKTKQPEDELEPQDEAKKRQRLLQLSGYLVEVLEQDEELNEQSLPCSFQVNTYKMQLRPDGSSSSTLSDSLILSAVDEESKKLWVKHIKFWNRYGWRETVEVAATHDDLEKLQEKLQSFKTPTYSGKYSRYSSDETYYRAQNSAKINGSRSSLSVQSSCATRGQSRRRFYRTAIPGSFAPPS